MIRGLVQGVGFRPFIYRTALRYGLRGEVDNRTDGVSIVVNSDKNTLEKFCDDIIRNAPPVANIRSLNIISSMVPQFDSFRIAPSRVNNDYLTEVSPDIAVCADCLSDLNSDPHLEQYPLINCTSCGPRFTITRELPYDRHNTSMKDFVMCPECGARYNNITDRRFHAQPVSCNVCGPKYFFRDTNSEFTDTALIILKVASLINSGRTVALKGVGGYHLCCDALNEDAVRTLRHKKQRDAKPFAVMFRDMATAEEFCILNKEEKEELSSWRRPVVIVRTKKELAPSVNSGLCNTGAMLPCMPFHYMMFKAISSPAVVMTSGNISDEPVITDDAGAKQKLGKIADAIVSYNREIINRADDSVVRFCSGMPSLIRRSRGYVPGPVCLSWPVEGILSTGAEQKNSFCLGKGNQAIMSQYIGDLTGVDVYDFFNESVDRFRKLFHFTPSLVACDLHPDYLSTRYAEKLSTGLGIPLVKVQHHHAHVVSCMAENGIDEPVIGVSLDGTGLGTDNTIWGGEFFLATLSDYKRCIYFDPVPLPGGDKAVKEPWRTACSYLLKYFGEGFDLMSVPSLSTTGENRIRSVCEMIKGNVNVPLSSGAGRLFDAVSALLGLCMYETFDSEAPVRLESAVDDNTDDYYPYEIDTRVMFGSTFKAILSDLGKKNTSYIAAKFHNTVARLISDAAMIIKKESSVNTVVLSGGVFQNMCLLEKSLYLLSRKGFRVFTNHLVPSNDGGISLGQLVTASKSRN